jgi:hypothetical protein
MTRLVRFPVTIAVLLGIGAFASSPVSAQQKQPTTTAPPKAPAPGPLNDPILQQRITLNLKDATINQTAEALSKVANVSLIVERPASLALRPMTVAINGARLRDVMDILGQMYGYRWRRKNDVFLLTLIPQKQDVEQFAKEAMETIYNDVLTPEQRAKVDASGELSGKDLTPAQQSILSGYLQDMMSMLFSSNLGENKIDKVILDRTGNKFSINVTGSGGEKTP